MILAFPGEESAVLLSDHQGRPPGCKKQASSQSAEASVTR